MATRRSFLLQLTAQLGLSAAISSRLVQAASASQGSLLDEVLGLDTFYQTVPSDTLLDIARAHDLGYVETVAANPGIDPWLPKPGTILHLPTAHVLPPVRRGIVVNLAAMRLFAFLPDQAPMTFPIGTGVDINMTPTGQTRVVAKQPHPTWYPPASIRTEEPDLPPSVPPGPDDPLGDYLLLLGWTDYGIHGTNKPYGVGRHVSHGCIRLYPEDIARLFPLVPVGTPVTVINEHELFGWSGGDLYFQAYPNHAQVDSLEIGESITPDPVPDLDVDRRAVDAAGNAWRRLDWQAIDRTLSERRATAVRITR